MIILTACLLHVDVCINIVFLSHVCTQQEAKLGSCPEGWGEGSVCLSRGARNTHLLPPKAKKQQLSVATQTATQGYSYHLKSHFTNSDLSSPQDEQFVCTSEEAKAPEMGS